MAIKNQSAADRYWAKCMGQDSAIDDEAAARIKEFLKGKLSASDHETLCSMIDGDGEAPDDVEGKPAMDGLSARQRVEAADSMIEKRAKDRADFYACFPTAAKIKIDTSGLPLPPRAPSHSDAAGDTGSNSTAGFGENFVPQSWDVSAPDLCNKNATG